MLDNYTVILIVFSTPEWAFSSAAFRFSIILVVSSMVSYLWLWWKIDARLATLHYKYIVILKNLML